MLITAPRRSPATPNDDGSYALYTVSKYSLDSHSETKEIRVINIKTGQMTLFSNDSKDKEPSWLKGNQIVWSKEVDGGVTELWIGTAGEDEKKYLDMTMSRILIESLLIFLLAPIWQAPFLHLLPTSRQRNSSMVRLLSLSMERQSSTQIRSSIRRRQPRHYLLPENMTLSRFDSGAHIIQRNERQYGIRHLKGSSPAAHTSLLTRAPSMPSKEPS